MCDVNKRQTLEITTVKFACDVSLKSKNLSDS